MVNTPLFKMSEFDCNCGCGLNNIHPDLFDRLYVARYNSKIPFIINSASRCTNHNKLIKGSPTSSHLYGLAVDIAVKNDLQRFDILSSLMSAGFKRIGMYKNFIHVDIDSKKTQNVIWYS